MTQVYKKFGIPVGNASGKAKILFFLVLDMYEGGFKENKINTPIVENKRGIFSLELEEDQKIEDIVRIDARNKGLTDLTSEIGKFTSLKSLNASNNKLREIPSEIKKLKRLETLIVSNNDLSALPIEITELYNLKVLDISNNTIKELPVEISNLQNLKALNVDNTGLNIPPEILQKLKTPKSILEYYFQNLKSNSEQEIKQLNSSVIRLNEVKVLLVGEAKVGKTSLVNQLIDKTFDPNEYKTEGIDIRSCFLSVKNEKVRLNLWDFGGQEIMHATHQFFLTKRSLYLLVLDARRDEAGNRLEYWLKIIESFSDNSPVIIVGNQVDQHPLDLDRRGLKKKYPNIKAFVETSCRERQGFSSLIREIKIQVSNLEHVFDQIPQPWIRIKKKLEKLDRDYISYNSYIHLCTSQRITNGRHQKILIGFLHDLGIVLNFQDDPRLQHNNILNPEWVTTAVYKILNDHALMVNHRGILELQMLDRILDQNNYPADKHSFILDIMRKFELCFLLEGYSGERYLLPDLLTKEEPETGDWSKALSVRYQYNVLPGSIISRFIVRMNQLVSKRTYWRNGVVLRKGDNKALVKADREESIISIFVIGSPSTRRHLIESIRDQLDYIHDTIPSIQVNEQISLPEQPDIWIDYKHLLTLESVGEQEWIPTGYDKKVSIKALLRGIETEAKDRDITEVADNGEKGNLTLESSEVTVPAEKSKQSENPWSSGFFYLFSLSVISTVFAIVSHFVAWYILPVVIVGTLLAIGMVGALQLRQDNRFSEENFLILLVEAYKQLPFLPKYKSERDSEA